MNCPKCQEENDLDCESRCWKCGEKLDHGRSASSCSADDHSTKAMNNQCPATERSDAGSD